MKESKDKFELELYRNFMYGLHKSLINNSKGTSTVPTIAGMNMGMQMSADWLKHRLDDIKELSK